MAPAPQAVVCLRGQWIWGQARQRGQSGHPRGGQGGFLEEEPPRAGASGSTGTASFPIFLILLFLFSLDFSYPFACHFYIFSQLQLLLSFFFESLVEKILV